MSLAATSRAAPSDAFRAALVSLQRKSQALEDQLATSEQAKSRMEHETTMLKGDLARAKTESSMLMDRNRALEDRQTGLVKSLQDENKKTQEAVRELLREKADLQSSFRTIQHESCVLRENLTSTQRDLQTAVSAQQTLRSQLQIAEAEAKQAGEKLKYGVGASAS